MSTGDVDNWFPFYVNSYVGRTMKLTTLQHGAFMLLMLAYWKDQGPLRDDDEDFASITRQPLRDWQKMRPKIEPLFNVAEGSWRLARMDKEIEKARRNLAQKSKAGRASAEAKAERKRDGGSTGVETREPTNEATARGTEQGTARPTAPPTAEATEPARLANPLPLPLPVHPSFGSLSETRATDGPPRAEQGAGPMRLSPDWTLPGDLSEWAVTEAITTGCGLPAALAWVERTAAKFKDFWLSAPGDRGLKDDWAATWRNWVRTEIDQRRGPASLSVVAASGAAAAGEAPRIAAELQYREATPEESRMIIDLEGGGRKLTTDAEVAAMRACLELPTPAERKAAWREHRQKPRSAA